MSRTATAMAMIAVVVAGIAGTFLLAEGVSAATPKPAGSRYGYESPAPSRTRMRPVPASPPASPSAAASSLPVTGARTGLFAITGLAGLITGAALLTLARARRIHGASPSLR